MFTSSADPSRLLLTFGANTALRDRVKHNTALHWAIGSKNLNVFNLLIKSNASVDIPNGAGETAFSLLKKPTTTEWVSKKFVEKVLDKAESSRRRSWFSEVRHNEVFKLLRLNMGCDFVVFFNIKVEFYGNCRI
jgi:hypothetical protein